MADQIDVEVEERAMIGVYIGPCSKLEGQQALLKEDPDHPGMLLAQFDRHIYIGGVDHGVGWHQFYKSHFHITRRDG